MNTENQHKYFLGIFLAVIVILSGCSVTQPPTTKVHTSNVPLVGTTNELMTFNNFEDLEEFLTSKQAVTNGGNLESIGNVRMFDAVPMAATAEMAMDSSVGSSAKVANTAGTTNTQYENVDEADFVKNDNQYIYMLADGKLIIIDAADAENAKVVSKTVLFENSNYQNNAQNLFLYNNLLVVLASESEEYISVQKYDIMPQTRWQQKTVAYLYDVTNREAPKRITTTSATGNYMQARLIDNVLYFITQESPWYGKGIIQPLIREGDKLMDTTFHYFDNYENDYSYNNIVSVNLDTQEIIKSETYLLGQSTALMMSEDALFISYQNRNNRFGWNYYGNQYEEDRFYKVIVPLLKGDIADEINAIIKQNLDEKKQWKEIQTALSTYLTKMRNFDESDTGKEELEAYESMMETIQDALNNYDMQKQLDEQSTSIHKITLNNGEFEYTAKGTVPGRLLNQFSMDEFDNNLRVATTVELWGQESIQYNNVFVLDEDMNTIGKLENIAPDERIYSVRFMGDEAYMVTFRQVDPFFVLDLSHPTNPIISGKLKLPGYSDYLHPIGNDLIIGVGKDTKESEWGGVTTLGVKVALFDVSDTSNPRLVDAVVIGDKGSSSPVLTDHKAFRYDKKRNLLILPVRKVSTIGLHGFTEWTDVTDAAYVFAVSENGFEQQAIITHEKSQNDYYSWRSAGTVMRSTYFDNYLYTISSKFVKANDMDNDFADVTTIKLPYSNTNNYW